LSVDGLSTAHVGTRAVRRGVSESCGRRALARACACPRGHPSRRHRCTRGPRDRRSRSR